MKALSTAFIALALVAVACSSAGTTSSSGGAPFEVPGEPVVTSQVELPRSYRFDPAVIEIDTGAKVTWTNEDDFPHNVTLLDDSGRSIDLPVGGSGSLTFDTPGTLYYQCAIHPQQMKGKIVVSE
jgi:plastocyanin